MSAISNLQDAYRKTVDGLRITVPEGTSLFTTATQALEMCRSYADDSVTFADRGDLVNTMASCAYGGGWVDAGLSYGLLTTGKDGDVTLSPAETESLPMEDSVATYALEGELLPPASVAHLIEKTFRYRGMLYGAVTGVKPAPDPATAAFLFTMLAIASAEEALFTGDKANDNHNQNPAALAWYSYGYGWLDFAVRAGLLKVTGERSLFTI